MTDLEDLRRRAKAGDLQALQTLRDQGFFARGATVGYPVSHAQRRIWIVEGMADGFGAYNIPLALHLEGPLDPAALRTALDAVARRHETLRTTFAMADGELRQFVQAAPAVPWDELDLAGDPERAHRIASDHAVQPFDLAAAPPLRARLLRLAPDSHLFLLNLHHIAGDLASLDVLLRELAACYAAYEAGGQPQLAPLPLQYKEFATRQNRLLAGPEAERLRSFWLHHLAGGPAPLDLSADRPRPPLKSMRGAVHRARLGTALPEPLRQIGLRHRATFFMTLTACLAALLHRYTGQDTITIGFAVLGRDHPDLAGQIGCYVNTVALRTRLDPADTFASVLERVRMTMLGVYEHQAYPFDRLVRDLGLPRDLSRSPVFDVSVALADAGQDELRFGAARASPYDDGFAAAKVDLSFDFTADADGLDLAITYATDLFDADRARRMADHFACLAADAAAHPDKPIARLDLMPARERHQVVELFNDPAAPPPDGATVLDLFERHAEAAPDAVALRSPGRQLSYGELRRQADRLARRLARMGVGPEVPVSLFMTPGPEAICGLLAILKAGGVYVPLDPANPPQRLALMLEDLGAPLILTEAALAGQLPEAPQCKLILWGGEDADEAELDTVRRAEPDWAAYAIFTSGSTGRPKPVVLTHRGLANVAREQARLFAPGPRDRVLQFAALGFDASVFEVVMALCHGATLCCFPPERLLPGPDLLGTLEAERITVATFPPSALTAIPDAELPALRVLTVAGEACPVATARRWSRSRAFFNLYGPTEATIWATAAHYRPDEHTLGIGRPIGNTRAYILDPLLQPVPVGIPGELCLAGEGMARHYLNRPELTAARFVPDPFKPGARLYKTGDLARYRRDGEIELLGRIDQQIKLRGYRIEAGDVEAALARHEAIREALVLAREIAPGQQRLVAYVTPRIAGAAPNAGELRRFLREMLPEYMVPSAYLALDEFPLTVNKKVDRDALPLTGGASPEAETGFVAPRDDLERVLASFYAELLRVDRVGAEDDFFELGGDSLVATRLVSRLRDTFKAGITVSDFLRARTVGATAVAMRGAAKPGYADRAAAALLRLRAMSSAEQQALKTASARRGA